MWLIKLCTYGVCMVENSCLSLKKVTIYQSTKLENIYGQILCAHLVPFRWPSHKLHSSMSWSHHIQVIINKATKMLNFNLLKELYIATAYSTLVRPILEYATIVWDPYQQYLINNTVYIEMVQ